MQIRSRPNGGALSPGTDPVALRVITAVVLAGLIMTGVAVAMGGGISVVAGLARTGGSGRQGARLAAVPGSSQASALKLLSAAAHACRSVAYEGVEAVDWHGPRGSSTSVLDVWHQRNSQTLAKVASAPPDVARPTAELPFEASDRTHSLEGNGILGMDARLVSLIRANYSLSLTGRGEVVGRVARIVTVRRHDGTVAARFWLDSDTSLPLRRQMFGPRARLVSDVAFTRLTLAQGALSGVPGPGARPWGDKLTPARLAGLRAHGWPLPGPKPAGLVLLSAKESITRSGTVLDLDYSDGLSVVSIFIQHGHLPVGMTGWMPVTLAGHLVYADDPSDLSVTWSARGFVYTVIAAAPQQTVGEVVAALPHNDALGFLGRIRRGMHRLFSWVKP